MNYKPFSLAELPVSIFGSFFEGKREERLRYLGDIRDRLLNRTGSYHSSQLTLEDIVHQQLIPEFRYILNTCTRTY